MVKKILTITFISALLMGVPATMHAAESIEIIDNDFENVAISVAGSVLHVTGAQGQNMQVYNVAGVCVMNVKIDGQDKLFDLSLPKGCYIIKIGKTVRKISIK